MVRVGRGGGYSLGGFCPRRGFRPTLSVEEGLCPRGGYVRGGGYVLPSVLRHDYFKIDGDSHILSAARM